MKLWYLGDSVLSSVLQQVAAEKGLELIDSSSPQAPMEAVWTEQLHEQYFRANKGQVCVVVLFVNTADYDSETLITLALQRVARESKIVLVVHPEDAPASEGMTAHWTGDNFVLVRLASLDDALVQLQSVLS